jgi:hypothetical protein
MAQARKNADRWMIVRTCRHKAAARSRARHHQEADKSTVPRAGRNTRARRGQAYKGRKVPDRQRYDWRREWRRNGHPRPPAWGRRDNRVHARRKWCPRARAAPAVGNRPLSACAGPHRAAQNRATASAAAMVKGLVKTGQSWRQRTARKTRTRFRIVSAQSPSPVAISAAAEMSLKLGRPLGASLGAPQIWRRGPRSVRCLPQRWQTRSRAV